MAETIRSCDARPGDKVRHTDGLTFTLKKRKTGTDASPLSGWWLEEGGGLADRAIDELGDWIIVRPEPVN